MKWSLTVYDRYSVESYPGARTHINQDSNENEEIANITTQLFPGFEVSFELTDLNLNLILFSSN